MKRGLFLLAGLLWWGVAGAQDMILLRNANEIRADVTEITDTEILYKAWDGPDTVSRVPRSAVFSVTYRNGERELFKDDLVVAGAAGMTAEYPWPQVTRSYRPGDLFDEGGVRGLVISTTAGGRHGLLLSLEQTTCAWCGKLPGPAFLRLGLTDSADGWNNRAKLLEWMALGKLAWDDFPAFRWCESLGTGWYLPAVDELSMLWNVCDGSEDEVRARDVNAARKRFDEMSAGRGGDKMIVVYLFTFLSSTEVAVPETATGRVPVFVCNTGFPPDAPTAGFNWCAYGDNEAGKQTTLPVRAVHKF